MLAVLRGDEYGGLDATFPAEVELLLPTIDEDGVDNGCCPLDPVEPGDSLICFSFC